MAKPATPVGWIVGFTLVLLLITRPWVHGTAASGGKVPADSVSQRPPATLVTPSRDTDTTALLAGSDSAIGDFMYLFDVSASVHNTRDSDVFNEAIDMLVPSIAALQGLNELLPERHRVGTIGSASLRQRPLCDIGVPRAALFADSKAAIVTRTVRVCDQRLRVASPEQYTDIRGALHFAALTLQRQRPGVRGIIVVSDLDEDMEAGRVPATPNLHGLCVAVFSLVTDAGARDPTLLADREKQWRSRITGWGALGVRVQSVLGFRATDLADFFRGCETRR
jgi:hypothetical protein